MNEKAKEKLKDIDIKLAYLRVINTLQHKMFEEKMNLMENPTAEELIEELEK